MLAARALAAEACYLYSQHFFAELFLSGGALLLRNFVPNIAGKEFVLYNINISSIV